jgi:hypothetical protein
MQSLYAYYDGVSIRTPEQLILKKGQKILVTILDEDISATEESMYMLHTSLKSGAFDFLMEDKVEYTSADLKTKYK